jgi:beta-lactamase superfamily II metal-dependent hydrolase
MEIEALGAAHGDATVVRWLDGTGTIRLGLVDGGPAKSYAGQLQPNLDSLAAEFTSGQPLALEFVCVSHIDDDHIGGIERLFTTIRRQLKDGKPPSASVKRLWFNSWDNLGMAESSIKATAQLPVVGASVRQGRDLRDIARLLHLDGNQPVGSALTAGVGFDLAGLRVDIVAPGTKQLEELLAVWKKTEQHLPAFTAAYQDRSIPNLSSIALLVRSATRTALLTGDARGDHLLDGLATGGFLTAGHLHVDVLKVPHHGSINNVGPRFFETISADRYIISADGITHGLPTTSCLDLLLQSRPLADEYEVLLTNEMPAIEAHLESARGNRPIKVVVRASEVRGLLA